ncbi:branched-chain amino acid ABC transporter substrate-binding protein [Saccharothrix sp.]|uniref:branched-chain amino acid ABC transporter substrate-binding protein n=1 Tax=Saccharothrix sp. TaxID=1873460 RepID=UPI0028112A05|nr:branched-chain amino acid ABC transporter substrate-binding protein [Saccharothrix sp.]
MQRSTLLLAGTALLTSLLTACSGGLLGSEKAAEGPIRIGMAVPLSGSSAPIGPNMKNGAQLAVDEINAQGGLLGRELELDVEDEACDATSAVAAANKLVSAGAVISVGGYCSSATLPTLPVFDKADIPMIIPAANSEQLVQQKLRSVFLINPTGAQQSEAAIQFIRKRQARTVAVLDDNTSYSTDIAKRTTELAKQAGITVTNTSVTPGESDYGSTVTKVLSGNPDFVYWTGYFQEGGLLVDQFRRAGYAKDFMVADGSVDPSLASIAGGADGVFATMTQTPDTIEGAGDWIAKYRKAFNAEPGPYSTQSYDAVRVAAEAIKKAQTTDGKKVVEALEQLKDFPIFSGPLTFNDRHTLSQGGFQILVVKGGKFVLQDSLR